MPRFTKSLILYVSVKLVSLSGRRFLVKRMSNTKMFKTNLLRMFQEVGKIVWKKVSLDYFKSKQILLAPSLKPGPDLLNLLHKIQ